MNILVTGFEPFGGEPTNPSWETVSRLPRVLGGHSLTALRLPVEYDGAAYELMRRIGEIQPDAVVSLGQAAGRTAITPETVALNAAHSAAPDAAGAVYTGLKLLPFGADGLFTNLRVQHGIDAMHAAGVPAKMSFDAGGYVCNAVMYAAICLQRMSGGERDMGLPRLVAGRPTAMLSKTQKLMEDIAAQGFASKMRCGFVHLPLESEQAVRRGKGEPSLPLEMMIRGISAYIPAALENA